MNYKTDNGGFAFKMCDAKIQTGASNWATRLSQLAYQKGVVRIITYSLPDMDTIARIFDKRPYDVLMIAHDKFEARAQEIKKIKQICFCKSGRSPSFCF